MALGTRPFTHGLHDLGDGNWALLVDTHRNGDHCNGNELLDCEVIASAAAAELWADQRT